MTQSVTFTLEVPPASKKNRRRWIKRGGKMSLVPSAEASQSADEIVVAALQALNQACLRPFGPNDALELAYEHDLESDAVRVTVSKVGELAIRERGTKRDLHGMIETIADALEGVLYPNDNQVDRVVCRRVRTNYGEAFAAQLRAGKTIREIAHAADWSMLRVRRAIREQILSEGFSMPDAEIKHLEKRNAELKQI